MEPRVGIPDAFEVECAAVAELCSTLKYKKGRFALAVRLVELRPLRSSGASESPELCSLDAVVGHVCLQRKLGCMPEQLVEHLSKAPAPATATATGDEGAGGIVGAGMDAQKKKKK